jgi:hypothetical protein
VLYDFLYDYDFFSHTNPSSLLSFNFSPPSPLFILQNIFSSSLFYTSWFLVYFSSEKKKKKKPQKRVIEMLAKYKRAVREIFSSTVSRIMNAILGEKCDESSSTEKNCL